MGLSRGIKALMRKTIGLWPLLEFRNSVMMAHKVPGLLRFENPGTRCVCYLMPFFSLR